jgi:hypothetical protein
LQRHDRVAAVGEGVARIVHDRPVVVGAEGQAGADLEVALLAGLDVLLDDVDELVAVGTLLLVEVADGVPDLVDDAAEGKPVADVAADGLWPGDPPDGRPAEPVGRFEPDEVGLPRARHEPHDRPAVPVRDGPAHGAALAVVEVGADLEGHETLGPPRVVTDPGERHQCLRHDEGPRPGTIVPDRGPSRNTTRPATTRTTTSFTDGHERTRIRRTVDGPRHSRVDAAAAPNAKRSS